MRKAASVGRLLATVPGDDVIVVTEMGGEVDRSRRRTRRPPPRTAVRPPVHPAQSWFTPITIRGH